jgi:prolipoprotein diacylglyceryltransferase
VIYSLSRFVIEFFKEEAPMTFLGSQTLTTGQFLSIALFLLGAYVLHSVFMSPRAKTKGDKEGSND